MIGGEGGSPDQTAKLRTPLKYRHSRVKVVGHAARLAEGAALKSGLAVARYPLLFSTLCDPAYRPAAFKRLLPPIDKVHLISGSRPARQVPWLTRPFQSASSFTS